MPSSSPSDRFQACIRLADFHAQRFDTRRSFEWKVTLGFWTAIILAINKVWGAGVAIPTPLILLAGVVFIAFWLRGIYANHAIDRSHMLHFMRAAQRIAAGEGYAAGPLPPILTWRSWRWWLSFALNYAGIFQTMTSVILLAVLWIAPEIQPNTNRNSENLLSQRPGALRSGGVTFHSDPCELRPGIALAWPGGSRLEPERGQAQRP